MNVELEKWLKGGEPLIKREVKWSRRQLEILGSTPSYHPQTLKGESVTVVDLTLIDRVTIVASVSQLESCFDEGAMVRFALAILEDPKGP